MAGFATDYLINYEGPDDWVCVSDSCTGYSNLIGRGSNTSAWWSPSRKFVAFGNDWFDVKPMPAATEPDEAAILEWIAHNPGWLWRMTEGCLRRRATWKASMDATQAFFDKHGAGMVYVEYRKPCGDIVTHDEPCGVHGPLFMLRLAINWMLRNMPAGTTVQKLRVSRRVPAHRKEIPTNEKAKTRRSAKAS